MTTWKKAREKSPTSIRKRMMMIFAVLISLTGLGIAALFIFVFRNGYSALSQVYLKDITRQTTNNLENNIQKIEDINLQILTSQTIQDQLKIVNEEPLDTFGLQQCRQKIERELATEGLYASYVVSVQRKKSMKLTAPVFGDWQGIRIVSVWLKQSWILIL